MSRIRDLRLEFLGTGTSAGVPCIGCDCPVCTSDDSRDRRLRCGAALRFTDPEGSPRTILIDIPPDHRQQALRHRLDRCDAILVTHAHVDHIFGLDEVRRYNTLMRQPIGIHAEPDVLESLHRIYPHIYAKHRNVNVSYVAELYDVQLSPGNPFLLHGLRIEPFRLLHGRLPILGFRVEEADSDGGAATVQPEPLPLAWCTDVSAVPPESWSALEGLSTLVLDLLREREHPTHLNLAGATDLASRVGARRTRFVHMSHEVGHSDLADRLPESMEPAWDGLVMPEGNPAGSGAIDPE